MSSLNPHSQYPALPEQTDSVQPDQGCSTCPLANITGHKSCNTFTMSNVPAVLDANRINLKTDIRESQAALSRRSFDLNGIVGSHNGSHYDGWYYYNAKKAINFVYFTSWKVTNVDGASITVEVMDTETSNAKSVIHSTWRERDETGLYWLIGNFSDITSVQPGDMLEFQWPSVACNALKAKILKVTAASNTSLTLLLDKNVSSCEEFFPIDDPENPGEYLPDPEYLSVKIYQYGREAEQWTYAGQEPMYLYGEYKQKQIAVASVPADGIWIIEQEIIAPPDNPLDPLTPYFVLEGFKPAEGETPAQWETINEHTTRLHIKPGYSAYSLKTDKPTGSIVTDELADLTTTYTAFRATYWVQTTQANSACRIVGTTCHKHRKDQTGSVAVYAATGTAGNRYCSDRVYSKFVLTDELDRTVTPAVAGTDGYDDTVTVEYHHATGLPNFPDAEDKICIQYNFCNRYENGLTKLGDKSAPFNVDYSMVYLRELWFNCDMAQRQKYILSPGFDVERLGVPSIAWQNGYYASLITPHAWRAHTMLRGEGTWFPVKPAELEDANGNKYMRNASGFERGFLPIYNADDDILEVEAERVGNLPANVAGYTTKRNPFTPGATVSDNLLEYIGAMVQRDECLITDYRGLNRIAYALGQESIVAPNFNIDLMDENQLSSRTTFRRDSVTGDATITILPYLQEDKGDAAIGSRVIHSVSSLGNGRYRIFLENETRTFSRFDLGTEEIGDSYNRIFSVMGGGVFPIVPYENQGLFSYEGDKDTGSRAAGAMPLDAIELPDGNRFVIESVTPHSDLSEATTWGSRRILNRGDIGGFIELNVGVDEDDNSLLPINIITIKRTSDNQYFTIVSEIEKPTLGTNQCWHDNSARLYFSADEDGENFEIIYEDREETEKTENHSITGIFTVVTETDYTEYTGAAVAKMYIGADEATKLTGTYVAPQPGEVFIEDNNGKIKLYFNIDDAPNTWTLDLQFNTDAPEPQDDWCAGGNYKSFGKKRDEIIIIADGNNGSDYFAGNNVVGQSISFYHNGTTFIPKQEQEVYITGYQSDNWVQIPNTVVTANAASGKIVIDGSYFSEMSGVKCFKVANIQMVDNRGQVPHSILQKTKDTIDSMDWVLTGMGGAVGSNFQIGRYAYDTYFIPPANDNIPWDGCTATEPVATESGSGDGFSGNVVSIVKGNSLGPGGRAVECAANVSFSMLNTFGHPPIIANAPDGCTIVEAKMELSTSGLTRHHIKNIFEFTDCGGNVVKPGSYVNETTLVDIGYSFVGLTSKSTFEVLGTIPGAINGTQVVDCTAIMQIMYAERNSGKYPYGFGVIFLPPGSEGDVEALVPDMPSYFTVTGECLPCGSRTSFAEFESVTIEWGGVSIGRIAINIDYNGKDKLDIIQPRFPSFEELP